MNLPPANWRLIISPPASGAWNMAVDESILLGMESKPAIPTLRFYAWTPPCLSLGYAQPATDVDLDPLAATGWHLVRRPTGGRAILHTDELTYSVIAPEDEPRLSGGVLESYQRLSQALLAGLSYLGVRAESIPTPNPPSGSLNGAHLASKNPVCFEAPSNYEITANGKKLIGSAQARKKQVVLQHGSIPLYGNLTRIVQVLHFDSESERLEAAHRLLQRATTIQEILSQPISWSQAATAFKEGFKTTLNLKFSEAELMPAELAQANRLLEEKYAADSWTYRV